jgi:tRNA A37 N6-isopentenylltransferase MiaA
MNTAPEPLRLDVDKLKPVLHDKIERMDGQHLALLNRLLIQLEAEELAERLAEAFDKDHEQGLMRRIPELVKQFRTGHCYA